MIPETQHDEAIEFLRESRLIFCLSKDTASLTEHIFFEPRCMSLCFGVLSKLKDNLLCQGKALPKDLITLWSVLQFPESVRKMLMDLLQKFESLAFLPDIPDMKVQVHSSPSDPPLRSKYEPKHPMRRVSSMPQHALAAFRKLPGGEGGSMLGPRTKQPPPATSAKVMPTPSSPPVPIVATRPASLDSFKPVQAAILIPSLLPEERPDIDEHWPSIEDCHETTHTLTCSFVSVGFFGRLMIKGVGLENSKLLGYWRFGFMIALKPEVVPRLKSSRNLRQSMHENLEDSPGRSRRPNRVLVEYQKEESKIVIRVRIPKRRKVASEFADLVLETISSSLKTWCDVSTNSTHKSKSYEKDK